MNLNVCLIQRLPFELKERQNAHGNNRRMPSSIPFGRRDTLNLMLSDFILEGVPNACAADLD
jgi:hypothetical protein